MAHIGAVEVDARASAGPHNRQMEPRRGRPQCLKRTGKEHIRWTCLHHPKRVGPSRDVEMIVFQIAAIYGARKGVGLEVAQPHGDGKSVGGGNGCATLATREHARVRRQLDGISTNALTNGKHSAVDQLALDAQRHCVVELSGSSRHIVKRVPDCCVARHN